jgi:hypothetical protein
MVSYRARGESGESYQTDVSADTGLLRAHSLTQYTPAHSPGKIVFTSQSRLAKSAKAGVALT